MAKSKGQRTLQKTKPHKTIIVEVPPQLATRLQTEKVGKWKRGTTSNLSIAGYLTFLFELNEYLPKRHKLTDYQIAKLLANEFPTSSMMQRLFRVVNGDRSHVCRQDTVQYYRYRYNTGILFPTRPGRKGPISFKYNSEGERISFYSAKEAPLSEKEYQGTIERYGPDIRTEGDFNWHVQVNHPVVKPKGRLTYDSFDWCI